MFVKNEQFDRAIHWIASRITGYHQTTAADLEPLCQIVAHSFLAGDYSTQAPDAEFTAPHKVMALAEQRARTMLWGDMKRGDIKSADDLPPMMRHLWREFQMFQADF